MSGHMCGSVTSDTPSVSMCPQNRSFHSASRRGAATGLIASQVLRTFHAKEGCAEHMDQNSVCYSISCSDVIKEKNISGAIFRAGKPTDIPVSEVLNGYIKAELYNSGRPGNWKERVCFRTWYRSSSKTERIAKRDAVPCSRISCGCVSASVNEIGGKSLDLSTIENGSSRKDPAVSAFTDSYIYRL